MTDPRRSFDLRLVNPWIQAQTHTMNTYTSLHTLYTVHTYTYIYV